MKHKIATVVLSAILVFALNNCGSMDETYKEFLEDSDILYPGRVDSIKVYPGKERVKFSVLLSSDPKVNKIRAYWNSKLDFMDVDVNANEIGQRKEILIPNISEGDQTFYFVTFDRNDNQSIPIEAFGYIYGDKYAATLKNRNITSISKQVDGDMLILWETVSRSTVQYVTIEYTDDVSGELKTVKVENDDSQTLLSGLKTGDNISVSTTYLPENGLDMVSAAAREYTMPKYETELDKALFAAVVLAGDNTTVNNNRPLSNIWDGKTNVILHTVDNAPGFDYPHHFTFDMGVLADISRFRLWARTDAGAFSGHSPKSFEIWATDELKNDADDEEYWKTDAWKADWKMMGDHSITKPSSTDAQTKEWVAGWEYKVSEDIGRVRYIRLVIKENWQGSNCVNIGEISLFGNNQ